jgi:bacillolysin
MIVPLAVAAGSPAAAAPSGDDALVRQLRDASGGHARIDKLEGTGKVRFVGTPAGKAIRRPSGVTANTAPETAARAFLKGYGRLFGVRDAARELKLAKTRTGTGGVRTVRFQQVHDGIPVVGGDLVVQLESDNDVVSAYGESAARPATTEPSISAATARAAALARIAKAHKVEASTLRAATPELAIFDSRLLGAPGRGVPALVWRTEVTAASGHEMREFVLVDAQRGFVQIHFDQLAHAKNREVCDNGGVPQLPADEDKCIVSRRVITEGSISPGASADAINAYEFAGDTYDFFFNRFGRDSLNDAGMKLTSVVRHCPDASTCPFQNAYWNGARMVYGTGYASADDVVGHELTHGVTEFESHLFYYYQSGAINESLSDVFGELIDLTNDDPAAPDPAGDRWKLGEDLPIGEIRHMGDPTIFNDPDRMQSPHWDDLTSFQDRGGVHSNSGVLNKFTSLITDGGSFNGQTVTGLGVDKVARIVYDASLMLTSASEYKDLNNILAQACDTAAAAGTDGITTDDCDATDGVRAALLAVEMQLPPPGRTTTNVFAPKCDVGQSRVTQFSDNLETPSKHATNWVRTALEDSDQNGTYVPYTDERGRWYLPQTSQPYDGWDPTYATSGTVNMWGDDFGTNIDAAIARKANVVPTSTTFLQFNHAYGFEFDPALGNYDAGRVEYSVNSGTSWSKVPNGWFTDNGYNGTVATDPNPNRDSKFAGSTAFVADSKGYTTSRINLGALAGQSVRFRFRIATDYSGGADGWYIDDISVYACFTPPFNTSLTIARSKSTIVYGSSVTISGKLTYAGTAVGIAGKPVEVFRRRLYPAGSAWTKIATVTTSSTGSYSHVSKPTVNSEYTTRFRTAGDFLAAPYPPAPNVYVAPKITATLSKTTMPLGSTSYLSGSVSPSHAGRTVRLQRYYSGAWHNVSGKSMALSSTSKYRFSIKPGSRGTFKYRVVLAAHSDHTTGVSPTKTLKVT